MPNACNSSSVFSRSALKKRGLLSRGCARRSAARSRRRPKRALLLPKWLQTNTDAEEWSIYSDSYTNAPRPSLRRPRLSLGIDSKKSERQRAAIHSLSLDSHKSLVPSLHCIIASSMTPLTQQTVIRKLTSVSPHHSFTKVAACPCPTSRPPPGWSKTHLWRTDLRGP